MEPTRGRVYARQGPPPRSSPEELQALQARLTQPAEPAHPAVALVRAGLALVPIPRGRKGPTASGWQTEAAAIRTEAQAAKLNGSNIGIAHRWCGTCCIDVDDYTAAESWLHARGLDLAALLMADDAVQIHSGKPNRAKLLYRLPAGVAWLPTKQPPGSGLELRCANDDGTATVQDVLPPSVHPDTGKPYEWRGDPAAIPALPDALLALWRSLERPQRQEQPTGRTFEREAGVDDWLAEMLAGGNLHSNAARVVARMAQQGVEEPVILATITAMRPALEQARGAERAQEFFGNELQRLVSGARKFREDAEARDPQDSAEPLRVGLDDLTDAAAPAPAYRMEHWLPANAVTLLAAHGGSGKSLLSLQLAVHLATGRPFAGKTVQRSRVLFYSAEDHAEILRYRLSRITARLGIAPEELAGWLHVFDLTETNPTLYREARGCAGTTGRYEWLQEQTEALAADVLVIDNASDVYDASEISRPRVREFIRLLARLVKPRGGAVLLVAHVDKATAKNGATGEGYSGSTAWNNSVRSRLYLVERNNLLHVEQQKSNYGPKAEPVLLRWDAGVLTTEDAPTPAANYQHLRAVLRLVCDFNERGENVSTATNGPGNTHKLLAGEPGYPERLDSKALASLLRDAERQKLITRAEYKTAGRRTAERWELTAKGRVECRAYAPDIDGEGAA